MSFSSQLVWRHLRFPWPCLALGLAGWAVPAPASAVTIDELLASPRLNAKKYASYFGDFAYEFNHAIQPPGSFLARRRGDCDDYAVLADYVLKKRGYTTRLIHVRFASRVAHAVCYVEESNAYLDYNNRSFFFTLTKCGPDIREIAAKVADSMEVNWTTASEFTYSYETQRKTMISTVSQTGGAEPASLNLPSHVD